MEHIGVSIPGMYEYLLLMYDVVYYSTFHWVTNRPCYLAQLSPRTR